MVLRVGHTRKRKSNGGVYFAALIFCYAIGLFGTSAFGQEGLSPEQIVRMQTQAEADLNTLFERIKTAETATKNAEQELIAQKQNLDAARSKLEEQRVALEATNTQQSTNQDMAGKLEAEIAKSTALRQQLEKLQFSSQQANKASVAELEISRKKIDVLNAKFAKEVTQNKELQEQLKLKLGELESLKQASSTASKTELEELLTEILSLKAALKQRDERLQKLDELQLAQVAERGELLNLADQRQAELASVNKELSFRNVQLAQLRQDFDENKIGRVLLLDQKSELETRLKKESSKLAGLQKSLDDLNDELSKSKAVARVLEVEKKSLIETRDELRLRVVAVEKEKTDLAAKSDDLNDQLAQANEDKHELRLKYQAVLEELKKLSVASNVDKLPTETLAYLNKPRELLAAASSDLMFRSGSARLSKAGKMKIRALLPELEEKLVNLPADKDWVLVVEGHADKTPIRHSKYKTNLALSVARSVSVVKEIKRRSKIDPKRLMTAGFGEHHPVNEGSAPEDLAANRRVELRLSER